MQVNKSTKPSIKEYNKLYRLLYPSLCVFANRFVNDLEKSKDIVQEVFINVWDHEILYEEQKAVKAFLYVSVRNKCLDFLKSQEYKLRNTTTTIDHLASDVFFEKEVLIEEVFREIDIALAKLPNKCRQIIELTLKGYQNQQIAEELQISINTVKTQKKIAYQRLRVLLKGVYFLAILPFLEK